MVKEEGEAVENKPCGACSKELPKDNFSKKQWQQKQQRRCKSCVESDNPIQTTANNTTATATATSTSTFKKKSSTNKKKSRKEKPVFAGNQDARHKPNKRDECFDTKLAYDICSWCGKVEEENEKLMSCSGCKNVLYCSRECQKAAYPEHKLVCEQMKQEYKASKKERKAEQKAPKSYSEASGVGSIAFICTETDKGSFYMVNYTGELIGGEQPGQFFATPQSMEEFKRFFGARAFEMFCQRMSLETKRMRGTYKRTEFFTDVEELMPKDQFLLSCGPLNDLERAKRILPYLMHHISMSGLKPDGSIPNIGDIKVRGFGLNALEWAARRGNYAIAEWLATDPRTKMMLSRIDSSPVAWACYTGKVNLAKMLVAKGSNSKSTTEVLYGYKPATHLASENGQLLALKYLVEECGHDIHECDTVGNDIRAGLRVNNKVWTESAGCVAVDEYAKSKGVEGGIKTRRTRFPAGS